ncbi:MAG: hypothetical protein M0O96_05005 [Desulforhopalus sp.]|nr:hypothetical protein [Desulforhopalus sp.]
MSESIPERLEKELKKLLGEAVPARAAYDLHAAIELAGLLEKKGFAFQLRDLCARSKTDTYWCATFCKDGEEFSAEDAGSSVAICTAAFAALSNQ